MKECPKCGKQYGDLWGVCLLCRIPLELLGSEDRLAQLENQAKRILKEIEEIRSGKQIVAKEEKPQDVKKEEVKKTEKPKFQTTTELPKQKKSWIENFEQILGGKLFNKLGILAVVIGIALLIGYSFKYLGAVGKISIGYVSGLGILIFGAKIEKKNNFSVYGKTLIGGAWAILYFTTYAMHHIADVQLIKSPLIGIVFLLGVSFAAAAHIYKYRSELATVFSYLLMFITLMVSPLSLYTMLATTLVALSLIFFLVKEQWAKFGLYGMAMTYFTYLCWFTPTPGVILGKTQFFTAIGFLGLYWAIFVLATFLIRDNDNNNLYIRIKEATHIVNAVVVAFLTYFLLQNGFMEYVRPALLIGAGLYLMLTIISYCFKQRQLCLISSIFSILFTAYFLALEYAGYKLTVSYIILAQVVFLTGIVLKEPYWRIFSFSFLMLILGKILFVDIPLIENIPLSYHLSKRILFLCFAAVAYLIDYLAYQRLERKKMLIEKEKSHPPIISYAYIIIYVLGTWLDLPKVLTAPAWMILGVILLRLGISNNTNYQRLQGFVLGVGSFLRLLMSNMSIDGEIGGISYRILSVTPVIMLFYYCVMLLNDEKIKAILNEAEKKMGIVYHYLIFGSIMFLTRAEAPKHVVAAAWGIIALIYSFIAIRSKKHCYLAISSIAAIAAALRAIFVNVLQEKYLVGMTGDMFFSSITVGALYAGNFIYLTARQIIENVTELKRGLIRKFLYWPRFVFGLSATILLTTILMVKLSGVMLTIGLGTEGLLLFLFGFGFKDKNWRIYGLIILFGTLLKAFLIDLRQLSTLHYILSLIALGAILLFVSFIYTKYKDTIKKFI
ncbi:MAG: DUF2339 domain-containing protein [Candidatus Omnitrophica bacterium]|nr:DUF2339 domain-containing protein [Candidatus Omnitrophota bacterium]